MMRGASFLAAALAVACTVDGSSGVDDDDDNLGVPATSTGTGEEGTGAGNGPEGGPVGGPSPFDSTNGATDEETTDDEPEVPVECQEGVLPPGFPEYCLEAVVDFVVALGAVSGEGDVGVWCERLRAASDFVLEHSSEEVTTPSGKVEWTMFKGYLFAVLQEVEAAAAADVRPCGLLDGVQTLCSAAFSGLVSGPPAAALGDGPALVVTGIMQGPIPMNDPDQYAQFGFVFETDENPSNDWQAQPPFTNDFFQGTDLWIQATYDPATGWAMEAARIEGGSSIVPYESAARIVIDGETIYAIIPTEELGGDCPRARLTAFSHGGDFGLQPPYTWSGDNELPISQPMLVSCRA